MSLLEGFGLINPDAIPAPAVRDNFCPQPHTIVKMPDTWALKQFVVKNLPKYRWHPAAGRWQDATDTVCRLP